MIYEKSYLFSEINLDRKYLCSMLGFTDGALPEPFDEYVVLAMEQSADLCMIRGAFCFAEKSELDASKNILIIDGKEFGIGKTVGKELREATSMALFICTAGENISHHSAELLKGDNPVLGYIFDVLGSMIVEAATDLLQQEIRKLSAEQGLLITNRYSPGYCKWSVGDQHKLFSFFPAGCCGIHLTDSSLMNPIKSVSGLIGLGKKVAYREYTCNLCNIADCFHRSHHRNSSNAY